MLNPSFSVPGPGFPRPCVRGSSAILPEGAKYAGKRNHCQRQFVATAGASPQKAIMPKKKWESQGDVAG